MARGRGMKANDRSKTEREGQRCRKCSTAVVRIEREPGDKPKPNQAFFFVWWFKCPKCQTIYLVNEAKRYRSDLDGSKASLDDLFETVANEVSDVENGRPPFD